MKNPEEIKEALGKLTSVELRTIDYMIKILTHISENPDISEDMLADVKNLYSEIKILEDLVTERLIFLYKRGYKL